jgi:hypothetical protein
MKESLIQAKDPKRPGIKIDPKFVPADVRNIILEEQTALMKEHGGQRSQEAAIYSLIRKSKKHG